MTPKWHFEITDLLVSHLLNFLYQSQYKLLVQAVLLLCLALAGQGCPAQAFRADGQAANGHCQEMTMTIYPLIFAFPHWKKSLPPAQTGIAVQLAPTIACSSGPAEVWGRGALCINPNWHDLWVKEEQFLKDSINWAECQNTQFSPQKI